jgi:hypothetical protein
VIVQNGDELKAVDNLACNKNSGGSLMDHLRIVFMRGIIIESQNGSSDTRNHSTEKHKSISNW